MNEVIALETKKKRKREVLSYNKTIISYYIGLQVTEICIFAFFREEWVQQLKLRLILYQYSHRPAKPNGKSF